MPNFDRFPQFDAEFLAGALGRARRIVRERWGLDVTDLEPLSRGYNNSLFKITLASGDSASDGDLPSSQPGCVPLPTPRPAHLLFRIPRQEGAAQRFVNAVAAADLVRRGGKLRETGVRVPDVYAWSDGADGNGEEDDVWSLEGLIEGVPLDQVWEGMDQGDRMVFAAEVARVYVAFRSTPLPAKVGFGGLRFASEPPYLPEVAVSPHISDGPFDTAAQYYSAFLKKQWGFAKVHPVLRGWSTEGDALGSSIAGRVQRWLDPHMSAELQALGMDEVAPVLMHGDLDLMNILVTAESPHNIVGLLDYEFTQLAHPADDYFVSLRFVSYFTDDSESTPEEVARARLLSDETVPESTQHPVALAFDTALERLQGDLRLRWRDIQHFERVKKLHWFGQNLHNWWYHLPEYKIVPPSDKVVKEIARERGRLLSYLDYLEARDVVSSTYIVARIC